MNHLYREEYICPGPTRVSHGGIYGVGKRGEVMCFSKCLLKADCACGKYLKQAAKIDDAEACFVASRQERM